MLLDFPGHIEKLSKTIRVIQCVLAYAERKLSSSAMERKQSKNSANEEDLQRSENSGGIQVKHLIGMHLKGGERTRTVDVCESGLGRQEVSTEHSAA